MSGLWLNVYGRRNVLGLVEREHHAERSDAQGPYVGAVSELGVDLRLEHRVA